MGEKRPVYDTFISERGIAKLTFLDKPSQPFDKGGKEQFKTRVLMEDTPELREKIAAFNEKAAADAKKYGVKLKKVYKSAFNLPEDADEDDFVPEEGKDKPKFDEDYRGKIWFEAKSTYKPRLIDTARQDLPDDVKIYGGDIIKVKAAANPYEGFGSGISLQLNVVQLVEKNTTYTSRRGSVDDFGDEEGYVADIEDMDEQPKEEKGSGKKLAGKNF